MAGNVNRGVIKMREFIEKHKNTVFRYWERKRMWTPYDIECKDPDQLEYGDVECSFGYIVEAIDLGFDWILGFSETQDAGYIEYYKLNDIAFAYSDHDQGE
jgi:hypothetical protein